MINLKEEILKEEEKRVLEERLIKEILKEVINNLITEGKTVATMESCTGGGLAHYITNIPGASSALRLGLTTYSNKGKIDVGGVPKEIIDNFTVYSMETAKAMALGSTMRIGDSYGIGITGQLKRVDPSNPFGSSDEVHVSVYDSTLNEYYNNSMIVTADTREENKAQVIHEVSLMLLQTIKNTKGISVVVDSDSEDVLYNTRLCLEPLGIKVFSTRDFNINLEGKDGFKAEIIHNEILEKTGMNIPIVVLCYDSESIVKSLVKIDQAEKMDFNPVTYYDGKDFFICKEIEECVPFIIKDCDVKKHSKN